MFQDISIHSFSILFQPCGPRLPLIHFLLLKGFKAAFLMAVTTNGSIGASLGLGMPSSSGQFH